MLDRHSQFACHSQKLTWVGTEKKKGGQIGIDTGRCWHKNEGQWIAGGSVRNRNTTGKMSRTQLVQLTVIVIILISARNSNPLQRPWRHRSDPSVPFCAAVWDSAEPSERAERQRKQMEATDWKVSLGRFHTEQWAAFPRSTTTSTRCVSPKRKQRVSLSSFEFFLYVYILAQFMAERVVIRIRTSKSQLGLSVHPDIFKVQSIWIGQKNSFGVHGTIQSILNVEWQSNLVLLHLDSILIAVVINQHKAASLGHQQW